jgi:hypothetical protein
MKTKLTLGSIKDLDNGRLNEAFRQELAHVVRDCNDRSNDQTARKVSLVFSVTPKDDAGEAVDVELEIKSTVPPRRSRPFEMAVDMRGGAGDLIFNDASPDNVKQRTLDETEPAPAVAGKKGKGMKYDDVRDLGKD